MSLVSIAAFYAAYFAFVGLYSPFLGPYLKDLGYSLNVIAWSLGMMQVMRIFGPFAWAWLCDHTGQRILLIRIATGAGAAFAAFAFLDQGNVVHLMAFIVLLNLSVSGLVPMSDAHALEACKGDSGIYGKVRLFGSIGFIASVLGFGFLSEAFGFWAFPYLLAGMLLLAFVSSLLFDHTPAIPQRADSSNFEAMPAVGQGLGLLFLPKQFRLFWLAGFFMILAHGVFYAFYSLYLLENGYSKVLIGWLWAFGVVCEVVFFWYQSRIFQRWSLVRWLQVAFFACVVRFAATAVLVDSLTVMFVAQSLHALTFAAHHTASVSWLRQNLPSRWVVRGQAMYATIAYGLGGSVGTWLGGLVWGQFGSKWVFLLASGAGLVALLVGIWLGRVNGAVELSVKPQLQR